MEYARRGLTRKEMLKLSLLGSAALYFPLERAARTGNGGDRLRDLPPLFRARLPVPPLLEPVARKNGTDLYEMTMRRADASILPGLKTEIWGYEGITPGPTLKVRSGRRVKVLFTNELPNPTTVHNHGSYTDGDSDGHPAKLIQPGGSQDYFFGNEQVARTQWYHDHAMHLTGLHVYNGLAGMYLIEDDFEENLPLPKGYGEHDIPLVIQDRLFNADGSLRYDVDENNHSSNGVFGDVMLVNGKPWPRMEVSARKYRFRVLNGSNAHPIELALSTGRPFTVIATEGGLMRRPVRLRSLPFAPAERYEIIVDFSDYKVGERVVLKNLRRKVGRRARLENLASGEGMTNIMRFDVVRREKDDSRIPSVLRPLREQEDPTHLPADLSEVVRRRRIVFERKGGFWTINGLTWDERRVDLKPRAGDVELWEFVTKGGGWIHPSHLHLVNFRIIERNGRRPPAYERDFKDTAFVGANDRVKVLLKWPEVPEGPDPTEFARRFPFHCHNLEHEDHDMMIQFEVQKGRPAA